ncbi:MAG: VOC family protein [Chloroflexota bacterium]|nr:MAG: glyoxalase [Chloroflexota bacterium]
MSRLRIQHVSVPRPSGSADQARRFYTDVLGLEEVSPPKALAHLDLVWYRIGDGELHLFAEDGADQRSGRHFCLEVDDLEAVRARLTAAGVAVEETIPIPGRPRFFCRDPFGNQIEVTTITGDYRSLEA